jgi:RIO-like serine/threonine protein kinase
MEGACGKILPCEDEGYIIKKIHRRKGPQQRTESLRAEEQYQMQEWARLVAAPEHGFSLLFVPKAKDPEKHQYKMERINVSKPISMLETNTVKGLKPELQKFYRVAKQSGIFPADFELYMQPDGRVAMIDFDKFATWEKNGSVRFPWGQVMTPQQVKNLLLFTV